MVNTLVGNTTVKQSNDLVFASYKLSPITFDILHVYLSQIKLLDTEFKSFKFTLRDIENILGKRIDYKYIDNVVNELMLPNLVIKLNEEETLKTSWCAAAIFNSKENSLKLSISNELKSYLLDIKNKFVISDVLFTSKLKGFHSKRIYLLLKKWESTGFYTTSVDDLKSLLCVESVYPKYADFKRRAISQSITQINAISDMNITLKEIKEGRSVSRLEFSFKKRSNKKDKEEISSDPLGKWLGESKDSVIDVEVI